MSNFYKEVRCKSNAGIEYTILKPARPIKTVIVRKPQERMAKAYCEWLLDTLGLGNEITNSIQKG